MNSDSGRGLEEGLPSLRSPTPVPVLAVHNLGKSFSQGKRRFQAVQHVSLTLNAGEILAFLGPNGAGKTTTIKMIVGLIRPDVGTVRILGQDPHRHAAALQQVGAVLEGNRNTYWRLTPLENLEYFGVLKGLSRRQARRRGLELLDRFQLQDKRTTPVQQLSRGMQQKLAIAVALIHSPQLMLLDEPTLSLDVEASEAVKALVQAIAQEGCGILLTTHQLDVAEELSHRVAIMRGGQLIAEKPTQALIQEFSGSTYKITVGEALTEAQCATIQALGGQVEGHQIYFSGSAVALYTLFDGLRPCPILEVRQDQADLTQVFLKLVRDQTLVQA